MGKADNFTPVWITETKPNRNPNSNANPNPNLANPNCSNLGPPLGELHFCFQCTSILFTLA